MEIIDKKSFREIVAAEGKYLHKVGSDTYFKRGALLPSESKSDYEEVDFIPDNDELYQAKQLKEKEIREYDVSPAVNEFVLQGKPIWLEKEMRVGLVNSINIEKSSGKSETALWYDGVRYVIPIDKALQMLGALELYALGCYNTTHQHIAAMRALATIEEVESYDYKKGYPEKLNF